MLPRAPEITLTAEKPAVSASAPQLISKFNHPVGCNRSASCACACRAEPSELRRCPETPPNSFPGLWSSQVRSHRLRHRAGAEVAPRSRTSSTKNALYSVTNAPKSSAARSMTRSLAGHQSCAHSHHVSKPIQSATNPAETDSMVIMEPVTEDDVETCPETSKNLPRNLTTWPVIHHPAPPKKIYLDVYEYTPGCRIDLHRHIIKCGKK
jgi:hypothetical protein